MKAKLKPALDRNGCEIQGGELLELSGPHMYDPVRLRWKIHYMGTGLVSALCRSEWMYEEQTVQILADDGIIYTIAGPAAAKFTRIIS